MKNLAWSAIVLFTLHAWRAIRKFEGCHRETVLDLWVLKVELILPNCDVVVTWLSCVGSHQVEKVNGAQIRIICADLVFNCCSWIARLISLRAGTIRIRSHGVSKWNTASLSAYSEFSKSGHLLWGYGGDWTTSSLKFLRCACSSIDWASVCDFVATGKAAITSVCGTREPFGDNRLVTALASGPRPNHYLQIHEWLCHPIECDLFLSVRA